ncbi:MAG: HAD family hydrolase [Ruminiclostridium sp.]|nr:HAD family hydrolase [Ruminiclostridium sp.]
MKKSGNPCIYVDRDGVLNEEAGYITSPEQLKIFDYAKKAVDIAKDNGLKVIVITNQSAIAQGVLTEKQLAQIHGKLKNELFIDDIYFCPHLYLGGNEVQPYNIPCNCRKPLPGMLFRSAYEHNIDLEKSFMVGDRASDILCGQNAGVHTVLVKSGYGSNKLESDVKPDYVFENILKFVENMWTIIR